MAKYECVCLITVGFLYTYLESVGIGRRVLDLDTPGRWRLDYGECGSAKKRSESTTEAHKHTSQDKRREELK